MVTNRLSLPSVIPAAIFAVAASVSGAEPTAPPDENLAKGIELIEKMSAKLAAAQSFHVISEEIRERDGKDGKRERRTVTRDSIVRRPDRMFVKITGDAESEGWYDGKMVTFIVHKEKVFAQAPMPDNLDETLDAISERFDVPFPVGDLFYSVPADSYLADTTRGGWAGEEDCGGAKCHHLFFYDEGVNWEMWLPVDGDPLPIRLNLHYPLSKRHAVFAITFKKWDLAPENVTDALFEPKVPDDYLGIPIIQSAAVLPDEPEEGDPAAEEEGAPASETPAASSGASPPTEAGTPAPTPPSQHR